ncbi:beta-lactamase/transpeptidase-like protein [Leptodontidium sp. MPI-SDFR-AT-0119]|nr:beta-lactamase/transpeptidase-like protein [Leptodontidium sp. MPI-SDFR-AT-0119]
MASLEEQFQKACDAREIPGVILLASDVKGTFQYQKAFGPKNATEKIDLNTTFILASCTKLMTSIAALQCVERGLITLDEDVSPILHELKNVQILKECEPEKEIVYEKPKSAITLRHLLTHTSGFGYDMMDPRYHAWRASRNETPGIMSIPMLERINTPILFSPGTSWIYGTSLDWVGVLIARLNHSTLEDFMETNIWTPLGIKNMTFHQEKKPDVKKNLVKMTFRKGIPDQGSPLPLAPVDTGEGVEWTDELMFDDPTKDEYGGAGAIGSPVEYMRILDSLLASDGKLLKPATVDELFRPQLSDEVVMDMEDFINMPAFKDGFANPPFGTKLNHGLGGGIFMGDIETGRRKGTLNWSGMPNLLWSVDREAGLNLLYASNVAPFGDYKSGEMQRLFETEMYKRFGESKK